MTTFLALALVTISEATIGVFVKLIGDVIPILSLNFFRVFFATIFLAVAMPFINKHFWRFPSKNIKDTLIIGAFIALQISIFNFAMTQAPIANVVIFWSISPFFAFIFSSLFLGEKAKRIHIIIFIIAMVGVLIAEPLSGGYALGNLISMFSGVVYAGLITYMRHEGKTEINSDIFWSLLFAAILLLPGLLISGTGDLTIATETSRGLPVLVWVAALGLFSTGVAYFFISIAIKRVSANVYSLVDTIVSPIVAAFLGFLVFAEMPSINMIYGGILLLTSGFWLTMDMNQLSPLEMLKIRAKTLWRRVRGDARR